MAPTINSLFLAEVATANPPNLNDKQLLLQEPLGNLIGKAPKKPTRSSAKALQVDSKAQPEVGYKWDIVWKNVLGMLYLHVFFFYGFYMFFAVCQWKTFFWTITLIFTAGWGVTAGAHRLWAHRCYKAKLPLRILLAFWQTLAFQNHIYEWVRDHRVHHKFTDSDADPHNAKRGFFFSHVGWLLVKKHKDITTKGKSVDLSDLLEDPVVRFQKRFYLILMPLISFILPMAIPYYFWDEDLFVSWYVCSVARYTFTLNATWLVNSAAHIYGMKPYDKNIQSTENKLVSMLALGEGWHNYHHVFPWDYKASEYGYRHNLTTYIIDFFAKIGWAYDLKTVSPELIEKRIARTGDGSRKIDDKIIKTSSIDELFATHDHKNSDGPEIWGWGDRDISQEHIKYAKISCKA